MDQYIFVLDILRLVTALTVLCYGAYTDVKERRVRNWVWQCAGAVAFTTLAIQMFLDGVPWYFYLMLPGLLVIFLYAYAGLPELSEIQKGAKLDIMWTAIYVVGILCLLASVGLTFVNDGLKLEFWNYGYIPFIMLVFYLMYYMSIRGIHLLHGGADAKCMIAMAVLFPRYPALAPIPVLESLPILTYMAESVETLPAIGFIFPFAVSVLVNAALVTVFMFFAFPVINIIKGNLEGPQIFFGYKMDIEKAQKSFVWLLQRVDEEGNQSVVMFPGKNKDEERDYKLLTEAGEKEVWITPKVPFIVPLAVSLVLTFVLGNILFEIIGLITKLIIG